jgi:hypothetical protein
VGQEIRRNPQIMLQLGRAEVAKTEGIDDGEPPRLGQGSVDAGASRQTYLLSVHCLNID